MINYQIPQYMGYPTEDDEGDWFSLFWRQHGFSVFAPYFWSETSKIEIIHRLPRNWIWI